MLFVHDGPHRHRCQVVLLGKGFQIVAVVFLHDALIAGDPLKTVALRYVDRLGSVHVDQLQIVLKADEVGHKKRVELQNKSDIEAGTGDLKSALWSAMAKERPDLYKQVSAYLDRKAQEGSA